MINYEQEKDFKVEYNNKVLDGQVIIKEVLTNNSIIHAREIK